MSKQQDLFGDPVQVRTMRANKGIKISFLLLNKLVEDFPRTFDDFHLTVSLGLADEVNHFCHHEANLVPLKAQICDRDRVSECSAGSVVKPIPGSRKNVLEPPAVLIHATLSADSILFIFQRWLNILR